MSPSIRERLLGDTTLRRTVVGIFVFGCAFVVCQATLIVATVAATRPAGVSFGARTLIGALLVVALLTAPATGAILAAAIDRVVSRFSAIVVSGAVACLVVAVPLFGPLAAHVWGAAAPGVIVGTGAMGVVIARQAVRLIGRVT